MAGEKKAAGLWLNFQNDWLDPAFHDYQQRILPFWQHSTGLNQFGSSFRDQLTTALTEPQNLPYYRTLANEQDRMLAENLARTGSPSSGRGQIARGRAAGEFYGRIGEQALPALLQLSTLNAGAPADQTLGYLEQKGNAVGNQASWMQADAADAARSKWGGLFGGIAGLFAPSLNKGAQTIGHSLWGLLG